METLMEANRTRRSALLRWKRRPESRDCAVLTAIEGTLLDFMTFYDGPVRPLIGHLQAAGVPVIPFTTMTLEELKPIAEGLGLRTAVIEAGGAIAHRRMDGEWDLEILGQTAETLLDVISEIERISGADLAVYSAMLESESASVSGRRGEMLRASMERHFSAPFFIERGDVAAVKAAAASLGFSVERGQRFYHLVSTESADRAFCRLRDEFRWETAIGVGGSPVDAHVLRCVDTPIIVPTPRGEPDRELLTMVPKAVIAPAPGARGWSAAVRRLWGADRTGAIPSCA